MSLIDDSDNYGYVQSLRGRVFSRLHNDILNGFIRPGESLIETKLSEEFKVSRTPIREALRQLELEGLVEIVPNKGAVVTGITAKDIEDIYSIRVLIEGLAVRWATSKITQEEVNELKEALELEEFYTKKKDKVNIAKCDSRFHEILFKASKSMPLRKMLKTFHNFVQRARNISFENPKRAEESLQEHIDIFNAILEGDVKRAEELTNKHVQKARVRLMEYIWRA